MERASERTSERARGSERVQVPSKATPRFFGKLLHFISFSFSLPRSPSTCLPLFVSFSLPPYLPSRLLARCPLLPLSPSLPPSLPLPSSLRVSPILRRSLHLFIPPSFTHLLPPSPPSCLPFLLAFSLSYPPSLSLPLPLPPRVVRIANRANSEAAIRAESRGAQ